jgi:hypothetical protein
MSVNRAASETTPTPPSQIEYFPSLTPHLGRDWVWRRESRRRSLSVASRPLSRRLAVIEMPDMHSLFLFEHKFDEFLFTPIGEEENGMVLNVMSAFARRNVDPWEEAARLSRLPRDVATRELCAMIAELPSGANRASPRAIAERLMSPLPFSAGSGGSSRAVPGRAALTRRETARTAVALLFLLVWVVFVTIAQQLASLEHIPAPTSDAIGSVK